MKRLIENYTFNPTTKQIIIIDSENIPQEKLLLITNMTDGIIIYNFADNNARGSIQGNIITLNYDTTSMSDTDKLQIWVEDTNPLMVSLCNCLNVVKHAVGKLSFDTSNQLRATVGGSLSSVTTVTTVTNCTTANAGFGDIGKPLTSTLVINQAYNTANSKNFVRG